MKIHTLLAGTSHAALLAVTMQRDVIDNKSMTATKDARSKLRATVAGYASHIGTLIDAQNRTPAATIISIDERSALLEQFGAVVKHVYFSKKADVTETVITNHPLYKKVQGLLRVTNGHDVGAGARDRRRATESKTLGGGH